MADFPTHGMHGWDDDLKAYLDDPGSLPAGSTLCVYYSGIWPARPTDRTDITVRWIGGTVSTPPLDAVEGRDIWERPVG